MGVNIEFKEQQLQGGTGVNNEQKQPRKLKQSFDAAKAIIGPGFVVAIAYLDPGSLQADIHAGSQTSYRLLWSVLWSMVLSLYVQMLCVRLAVYKQTGLAEAMGDSLPVSIRIISWVIAELTVILTDLPAVIGMSIAFNIFFGWPLYVGVLLSFVSTILFLQSTQVISERAIEFVSIFFIFILAVVLFISWAMVDTDFRELIKGTLWGFVDTKSSDTFQIIGLLGSVVMPHNLYLHTGCMKNRHNKLDAASAKLVVKQANYEISLPILFAFFINTAVIVIAAEITCGKYAGLTNFGSYLDSFMKTGHYLKYLWGFAMFSSSQSSCVTATYAGEMAMSGFLNWNVPMFVRAIVTRCLTILPCIVVAVLFEKNQLDTLVNTVNAIVAIMLPFALLPLIRFVSSPNYMGKIGSPSPWHSMFMRGTAFIVLAINSVVLLIPGGGFFGDLIQASTTTREQVLYTAFGILTVLAYIAWNLYVVQCPIRSHTSILDITTPTKRKGAI